MSLTKTPSRGPAVYVLVDRETFHMRMEPATQAMAVFATRAAARAAARLEVGVRVVKLEVRRWSLDAYC